MVVYIDIAMLISFFQNSCLLMVAGMCLKEKLNLCRIIAGGLVGALYQLLCTFYPVKNIFLSVVVALIQVFVAYPAKRFKLTMAYILVAVITAGIMYAIHDVFGFLSLLIIPYAVAYMRRTLRISSLNRIVTIKVNGKQIKISGFVDSGNELKIMIIGKSHAVRLLGKEKTRALLSFEEGGVIPCTTVKGVSILSVFNADSVLVDGKNSNVKIGVMNENLPYAILPVEFLEGTDINVEKTGAEAKEIIL